MVVWWFWENLPNFTSANGHFAIIWNMMTCMPKAYTCVQCSVSGCSSDTLNFCYHHKLCIHACLPYLYMYIVTAHTHRHCRDTNVVSPKTCNIFVLEEYIGKRVCMITRFDRTFYMQPHCANYIPSHVKGDVVYFWDRVVGWFIHIASNALLTMGGMIYEAIYRHPYMDNVHVCEMCMKLYIRSVCWRVVHGEKVLKNNRWKT